MKYRAVILSTLLVMAGGQAASAQAWESPAFMPPQQQSNLGIYGVDPQGGEWGALAIWRRAGDTNTLGIRAGVFDFDDVRVAVGADASRMLVRAGGELPVDVAATLGIGATFGDVTVARVPVGLTVGRRFAAQNWAMQPYVHPRLGIDVVTGGDSATNLTFTADAGADFEVGRNVLLRFGFAVGDHRSVGFGVAFSGFPTVVALQ